MVNYYTISVMPIENLYYQNFRVTMYRVRMGNWIY